MLKRLNSLLNAALAVTLLAGAVAVAAATGMIVTERPPSGPEAVDRHTPRIEVRGKVRGLYPGAREQMKVGVHNSLVRRVRLVSVRARVRDASPTCTREYVRVERFQGSKPIRQHRRNRVWVDVAMRADAPNACQGARFPISFKARVSRKPR